MSRRCFVDGCKSNETKDYTCSLRFFAFPQGKGGTLKTRMWLKAIEKGTGKKVDMKRFKPASSRVCELHFKKSDFNPERCVDGSVFMKRDPDSIPSLFQRGRLLVDEITLKKCRICLKRQGTLYIHGCLPKSDVTIIEAVKKTFNFDFYSQTHFPPNICARCFNLVVASYVLKLEMLKSDATFKKIAMELIVALRRQRHEPPPPPAPPQEEENVLFIIKEIGDEDIKREPEEQCEEFDQNYGNGEYEQNYSDGQNSRDENVTEDYEETQNYEHTNAFEESSKDPLEYNKSRLKVSDPLDDNEWLQKLQKQPIEWPGESRHECKKCGYTSKDQFEFGKHFDKSTRGCIELYEPKYECFICRRKFMLKLSKYEHIRVDHKDDPLSGECPQCRKFHENFKFPFHYERHLRTHATPPDMSSLYNHSFTHKKSRFLFRCDHCEFKGSTKNSILVHMKEHTSSS